MELQMKSFTQLMSILKRRVSKTTINKISRKSIIDTGHPAPENYVLVDAILRTQKGLKPRTKPKYSKKVLKEIKQSAKIRKKVSEDSLQFVSESRLVKKVFKRKKAKPFTGNILDMF